MKCFLLFIAFAIATVSSSPTPIRRNSQTPSCNTNFCIYEPAFCLCGFEETPNDPCCKHKCSTCPADFVLPWMNFELGSLNFFPLEPMNFTGLNFNLLGRR
ncbi:unnamed protein product [Adineta ricciae]|uniref:Uncharacterized protein n=1 Tax=Adineta ricciae TaxID=249248 RepID=A0A813SZN7_ADIRI|nr:unnamed protein product [Adineta ricciae]CAF1361433.1 unnamed protein product [Adineta ricciae]